MSAPSHSLSLIKDLLSLDAESKWTDRDAKLRQSEKGVVKRYLEEVLALLARELPDVAHSFAAISGLQCRYFQPVAAHGRALESIRACPTSPRYGATAISAQLLEQPNEPLIVLREPALLPTFTGDPAIRKKVVLKLEQYGEFFGFISLDARSAEAFPDEEIALLRDVLPVMSRTIADAIFSMRLRTLATSFDFLREKGGEVLLYDEIVQQAALGFAADGAVLRLYDESAGRLLVAASFPEEDAPLPGGARDQVCEAVFHSAEEDYTARSMTKPRKGCGVPITPAQEAEFLEQGIHSYLISVLKSELHVSDEAVPRLGTLSIFHSRDHDFSWRDIALFKAFCQRVSDLLLLKRSNDSLAEKYEQLEEQNELLRVQGAALTSVELVTLISHDLFHKAFANQRSITSYVERARAAMNNRREARSHDHLEPIAGDALNAARAISVTFDQLRLVQSRGVDDFEEPEDFELLRVIDDIRTTLSGAMARAKLTMEVKVPGGLKIHGRRSVLVAALYNLVINSIEAVRTRTSLKPSRVFIQAHTQPAGGSKGVTITVSDEGPGIDRSKFKNPAEIFKIGMTTKKHGTGTGLPAARRLLSTYLDAQLTLVDADQAMFQIFIRQ